MARIVEDSYIQELREVAETHYWESENGKAQMAEAIAEELEKMPEYVGHKWIPVTERLPEEYTTILVCGEDGVEPGEFSGKSGFWTYDKYEQDPIVGVTHWMPLPELPKGE